MKRTIGVALGNGTLSKAREHLRARPLCGVNNAGVSICRCGKRGMVNAAQRGARRGAQRIAESGERWQ